MQFVTYLMSGVEHVGLRVGGPTVETARIVDAASALQWLNTQPGNTPQKHPLAPADMLTVIRESANFLPAFKSLADAYSQGKLPASLSYAEKEVRLISPVPRPTSMRDGYAFRQHVEAARRNRGVPMIPEFDQFPVFYFTNHLAVCGPGELAVQKQAQDKLDFELEVAIVVGKPGRNIPAAKADEHIFGYMIMNDWSARFLQMEEMKLNLGPAKGKDFATGLGPYLITRDELARYAVPGPTGERHNLRMQAFVNGKRLSDGNAKDMNWTFAQIIERASYGVHLHAGDVIGSGTVGTGCLLELNGSEEGRKISGGAWLKPGDHVVMEVEGLGRLENTIVDGGE
jgi:fumarylacetoacetate (FAA) hydrolase